MNHSLSNTIRNIAAHATYFFSSDFSVLSNGDKPASSSWPGATPPTMFVSSLPSKVCGAYCLFPSSRRSGGMKTFMLLGMMKPTRTTATMRWATAKPKIWRGSPRTA